MNYSDDIGRYIFESKRDRTETTTTLALKYNKSKRTIRRWHQFYRQEHASTTPTPTVNHDTTPDMDKWTQHITKLLSGTDLIRIAIGQDVHAPHEDRRAIELYCKLVQDYRPHIIIDGSDVLDGGNISRWPQDIRDMSVDVMKRTRPAYRWWRDMVKSAAPEAVSPFIVGNHDSRFRNYFYQNMPQVAETIEEDTIAMIRASGSWWLGWKTDHVSLSNILLIAHGWYANKYCAAGTLEKRGARFSCIHVGHVHRHTEYIKTYTTASKQGVETPEYVHSVSGGALCNLRPPYSKSTLYEDWQLGFTFATIDPATGQCAMERILIHPTQYSCIFGGKQYKL